MATTQAQIQEAALRLRQASESGHTCLPVRDLLGTNDLEAAYAVQAINNNLRILAGHKIVGSKIGLTSLAVQRQLGVNQPDYGFLFADREVMNGGTIPWSEVLQPKAEIEIAFVLKEGIPKAPRSVVDVIGAIDYALAAIEIAGSRVANWDIRITDTIADNASASHFVLGHQPIPLSQIDVINCEAALFKNGEMVSEGKGAACMGSPLNAVFWLAGTMAKLGRPLKKGEIILSGAFGPMDNAAPGDHYEAVFEGLGTVSVNFGKS